LAFTPPVWELRAARPRVASRAAAAQLERRCGGEARREAGGGGGGSDGRDGDGSEGGVGRGGGERALEDTEGALDLGADDGEEGWMGADDGCGGEVADGNTAVAVEVAGGSGGVGWGV